MTVRDDRSQSLLNSGGKQNDPVVLIVGDVSTWTAQGKTLPDTAQLVFAEIDEITDHFLEDVAPDIVLSSIFTPKFDALDLAQALRDAGYCGRYRALSPRLPNPGLIRREVREICANLDFDILIVDQSAGLRPH